MNETINLSKIENMQNKCFTKNGDCCTVERILFTIYKTTKGRKPTYYYQDKKVIIDIKKKEIEKIAYCDSCGFQTIEDEDKCSNCGNDYGWFVGYRIKGTEHQIYDDTLWSTLSGEFKIKYMLKRFESLRIS